MSVENYPALSDFKPPLVSSKNAKFVEKDPKSKVDFTIGTNI